MLKIDAAAAAKLAAPSKNPGSITISPDDVAGDRAELLAAGLEPALRQGLSRAYWEEVGWTPDLAISMAVVRVAERSTPSG